MKYITLFIIMIGLQVSPAIGQRKVQQIDPEKTEAEKNAQKQAEQEKAAGPKWYDNISYGGNIGGFIGSGSSLFMLQPMAFYRITETTFAGAGVSYYYWSRTFQNGAVKTTFSDHAYGVNLFARQQLFEPVFAHVEYNPMNFNVYDIPTNKAGRQWVSSFYIGGGVNQAFSDRGGFYFMLLYDVLWDSNRSFRGTPIDLRTGFYF